MNRLNKENNPLVKLIYEKWNPEMITGIYGGIILSEINPNIALVNLYEYNTSRTYGCMVEMDGDCLNIIARYDDMFRADSMKKQTDDFIELRRNSGETCIVSGKDLLTIGKARIFDFIDNGLQRDYKYAYRYYRKENKTYVWNNVGELMYEVPFKAVNFIYSQFIAIVESPKNEEYYQLYSLKNNALIESEPLVMDAKKVSSLPLYWPNNFSHDNNYFVFLSETESVVVFSTETHTVVKVIPDEEKYDMYHLIGRGTAAQVNDMYIVKKDGLYNIQFNNRLLSSVWFKSYKIYDEDGYEEGDEYFFLPHTVKCILDEDEYDYFDLKPQSKYKKGCLYSWRYENFN